jgi:hypothetical protein
MCMSIKKSLYSILWLFVHAGDWIIFKPPKGITLTRVQFYARTDAVKGPNRAPGKFKLYGSYDGFTWTVLLDYTASKIVYTSYASSANVQGSRGYSYIGLVIGSLALANEETEVFQMMEWAIYGTPYPCIKVNQYVGHARDMRG